MISPTKQNDKALPTKGQEIPRLDASQLFTAGREVRIFHEGQEYRLRLTSNNKLILTK